jgi:hypothetical protein
VLFYRAALPLSRKALNYVAGVIRRHLKAIGSRWRKLNPGQEAGKHKKHGMNLQVIASPDGDILWVSGALPGSVHDKKAEWIWGNSPRPSTYCSSARPNQDGISSMSSVPEEDVRSRPSS